MVTKRRIAWTVYVLAVTALTVVAFQAGRAGACGNWCTDVKAAQQQFSNGTIFFKKTGTPACYLVLLAPTKTGGACSKSHSEDFENFPYGTPSCSASLGTLVTATGVDGTPSGSTSLYCCSSCN